MGSKDSVNERHVLLWCGQSVSYVCFTGRRTQPSVAGGVVTFYHFDVQVVWLANQSFDLAHSFCTKAEQFSMDYWQLSWWLLAKRHDVSLSMISVLILDHGVSLCAGVLDIRCFTFFIYL